MRKIRPPQLKQWSFTMLNLSNQSNLAVRSLFRFLILMLALVVQFPICASMEILLWMISKISPNPSSFSSDKEFNSPNISFIVSRIIAFDSISGSVNSELSKDKSISHNYKCKIPINNKENGSTLSYFSSPKASLCFNNSLALALKFIPVHFICVLKFLAMAS